MVQSFIEQVDSVERQVRGVANDMGQMNQVVDQMSLEMKTLKALQFLAVKGRNETSLIHALFFFFVFLFFYDCDV